MFASNDKSLQDTVKLDKFLSKLEIALTTCSEAIMAAVSKRVPPWAASCTHLLYSHKSIPPHFNQPGKLYISYKTEDPSAVSLVGKAQDKKPINRKLKISQKAGNLIVIVSEHKDFITGKCFSCVGIGKTFKAALDHYFSNSDLKKTNYTYNTDGNIQKEGDAFILPQVLMIKGSKPWITEIVNIVGKLIHLFPAEKHCEIQETIEKSIQDMDGFLKSREKENITSHYDARLWIIVESICKHFDVLTGRENTKRKDLRDYFIAECCSKFTKGENIIPRLKDYFDTMKMQLEISTACEKDDPDGHLKALIHEYKKNNLFPEIEEHRETIKKYHHQCNSQLLQTPSQPLKNKP